jgi:hypothetical protein
MELLQGQNLYPLIISSELSKTMISIAEQSTRYHALHPPQLSSDLALDLSWNAY